MSFVTFWLCTETSEKSSGLSRINKADGEDAKQEVSAFLVYIVTLCCEAIYFFKIMQYVMLPNCYEFTHIYFNL